MILISKVKAFGLMLFVFVSSVANADMFDVLEEGQEAPPEILDIRYFEDEKKIEMDFLSHGAKVYVEMIRGEKNPLLMRQMDPDAPVYAIDMRMLTSERRTVNLRVGGGRLLNKEWGKDFADSIRREELKGPDGHKLKEAEIKAFLSLPDIIKRVKFKEKFEYEYKALMNTNFPLLFGSTLSPPSRRNRRTFERGCGWDVVIKIKPILGGDPANRPN